MNPIMLINQAHTHNLGDVAIEQVMRRFLESRGMPVVFAPYEVETPAYKQAAVPDSAGEGLPDITPTFLDEENVARISGYLDRGPISAAVIGGGELVGSHYGFNSAFHNWTQELHRRGVPILVAGVSGDAQLPARYKDRLRQGLALCSYLSVRDRSTGQIVEKEYGQGSHHAPDVVFSHRLLMSSVSPMSSPPSPQSRHADQHRDTVVCMPVPFSPSLSASLGVADEQDYMAYLFNTIMAQLDADGRATRVMFTSTVDRDIPFARRAAEYATQRLDREGIEVGSEPYGTIDDLVRLMSRATSVITARMHGAIFGLVYGSRFVAIPFKEKLRVFSEEFGHGEDIDAVEHESLTGLEHLAGAISELI